MAAMSSLFLSKASSISLRAFFSASATCVLMASVTGKLSLGLVIRGHENFGKYIIFFAFVFGYIFSCFPIKSCFEGVFYGHGAAFNEEIAREMISSRHAREGIDEFGIFWSVNVSENRL